MEEQSYLGFVEMIFVAVVVFGFVIWQLNSVKRDKAKLDEERRLSAEAAERRKAEQSADGNDA